VNAKHFLNYVFCLCRIYASSHLKRVFYILNFCILKTSSEQHTAIENFNKNSLKLSTLSSEFCKKLQLLVSNSDRCWVAGQLQTRDRESDSIIKLVRSKNRGIVCGNFLNSLK